VAKTRIRNRIRQLRFERDEMSQQALAERIGVTRQTVAAIEKARYSPTLELAFQIAAVFDVPLDAVFSYPADNDR
jgi:putative transcriptional regulator